MIDPTDTYFVVRVTNSKPRQYFKIEENLPQHCSSLLRFLRNQVDLFTKDIIAVCLHHHLCLSTIYKTIRFCSQLH